MQAEVFKLTTELGDAWVSAPKVYGTGPRRQQQRVKGVVHFLGGAFAGAAPQVLYSHLLDLLSDAGYTVIATPYAVTFKHLDCADLVRARFMTAVQALRDNSATAALAPASVPMLGVGHSKGSLLHLLIGSRHPGTTSANVVMSYNNKQVSDAIPVPFLPAVFDSMSSSPSTASGVNGMMPGAPALDFAGLRSPDSASIMRAVASLMPPGLRLNEQVSSATLALDQFGTMIGEMREGARDFSPNPTESRAIIQAGYNARATPVLLLHFNDDGLDETREMTALLLSRNSTGVSSRELQGTHLTPCGNDLAWESGPFLTPLDMAVQLAKFQTQGPLLRLAANVVNFLDMNVAKAQVATAKVPA